MAFDKISLFSYLYGNKELENLSANKEVKVSSVEGLALLTALSYLENKRKMFFLFPTIYEAENFIQFLGDYVDENETYIFPYDEIFRTSAIGVSPEMNEERLMALSSIHSNKPSILVAHMSSVSLSIMNEKEYEDSLFNIKTGDMITRKELLSRISSLGYLPVDHISQINQYSVRGGILDIYDASYKNPVRLEFFGDEIDDIRSFKIEDERSFEHIKEVLIHPASLRLLKKEEIEEGNRHIQELLSVQEKDTDRLAFDDLKERILQLTETVKQGFLEEIDSRFYSLYKKDTTTLLSYLKDYEKFIYDYQLSMSSLKNALDKEEKYFKKSVKDGNSLQGESVYLEEKPDFSSYDLIRNGDDGFLLRDCSFHATNYIQSDILIREYLREGYKIRLVLPEPNLTNYENYLSDRQLQYTVYPKHSQIMFLEGKLTHGFEIPEEKHVYLSAKEIYGVSSQKSRFLSRYKEAKLIRRYEELKEGDYVVHEVHGVGRYLGVDNIDGLEYLKIQYANEQVFYLPLAQYKMIRKYASREGFAPALDKMGGSTWSRKKSKIRSRISYLADQLLALYSERKTKPGFAFPHEEELENEFMRSFSYPYTEGQIKAINEIREDMESPHPMDRLVAGDVGFGKTEIAFNAAFTAILAHKQVVLLCPTTILSEQHYKVAINRFKEYQPHIEVYNRFISKAKQDEIKKGLENGTIDFVIGTHSLLSDFVKFKNLGLLIIDEEQKFGVTHKEKIKEKAKNVDCLTLTATPIPRTMQMSLLGVRSMSLLSQAPVNRMPVKTYVAKQDNELIYEVIGKELDRHGQVYYLHNKISTIDAVAQRLQKKFKTAKVAVVHARMSQDEIEDVMDEFYQNDIQILVCTSIIESGLDIPNVNTIIVEDADHFGLAQLYQIKGRVGRSNRLAYAYFFFHDSGKLTEEARKRLKALKEFTELGSGYKIAMQDLNIRGAGDILGSEQAGFVDSLGYEAYMELLEEVIKEKTLQTSALADKNRHDFELTFSLDAHIPEEYGTKEQRISMYRELSDCNTDEKIKDFAEKLKDVYGPYPEEVNSLLIKKKIENYLNSGFVSRFVEGLGFYTITMSEDFCRKPQLFKKLDEYLRPLSVKLRLRVNNQQMEFLLTKTKDYLSDLLYLVQSLEGAYRQS